ncbi:MAG: hypothetical protein NTV49_06255 [Kiritimatiellaeota bacterium]|nr:hypothetical protein [Kiritimatiellota bacterium]
MDRLALNRPATEPRPRRLAGAAVVLLLFAALLGGGCATTNADSDIPWNTPQPWETAPAIPGFNR